MKKLNLTTSKLMYAFIICFGSLLLIAFNTPNEPKNNEVTTIESRPMSTEPLLAEVIIFAGSYVPRDWMACNGQELQISNYRALFSIIGTTYGGDGKTTFNLPNLNKPYNPNGLKYIIAVKGYYASRS